MPAHLLVVAGRAVFAPANGNAVHGAQHRVAKAEAGRLCLAHLRKKHTSRRSITNAKNSCSCSGEGPGTAASVFKPAIGAAARARAACFADKPWAALSHEVSLDNEAAECNDVGGALF